MPLVSRRRGELRIPVPIGYTWHREAGLGLDPDLRIQEVIRLVFARFSECGGARQVLLRMSAERVHFPRPSDGKRMIAFEWRSIRYRNVISVLKNPFCAGVYAYGKSEKRTALVNGHVRKSYGHHKPLEQCEVLLKNHHEGYIEWAEFERNQTVLAKSGRGRRALLAGLLTCGRCGRRLPVVYA
jgi:recombinase